jgi:hypothetical protein
MKQIESAIVLVVLLIVYGFAMESMNAGIAALGTAAMWAAYTYSKEK